MNVDAQAQMDYGLRKISEHLFKKARSALFDGEDFEWYLALNNAKNEILFTILRAELVEDAAFREQFLTACHLWGVTEYHIAYFGKQVGGGEEGTGDMPEEDVMLVFGRNREDSVFGVVPLIKSGNSESVGELKWLGPLDGESMEKVDLNLILPENELPSTDDTEQAFHEEFPVLDFDRYQKFSYHVLMEGGDVSNARLN